MASDTPAALDPISAEMIEAVAKAYYETVKMNGRWEDAHPYYRSGAVEMMGKALTAALTGEGRWSPAEREAAIGRVAELAMAALGLRTIFLTDDLHDQTLADLALIDGSHE